MLTSVFVGEISVSGITLLSVVLSTCSSLGGVESAGLSLGGAFSTTGLLDSSTNIGGCLAGALLGDSFCGYIRGGVDDLCKLSHSGKFFGNDLGGIAA